MQLQSQADPLLTQQRTTAEQPLERITCAPHGHARRESASRQYLRARDAGPQHDATTMPASPSNGRQACGGRLRDRSSAGHRRG